MSAVLINLLAFIVAISLLVAVHEYGHYIVGRLCGMKVLRFSIGFGKPIWTWVAGRDRTEYCISAIPLGGYVRFLDDREGPVAPEDRGRAFNHRPIPARILVLLAGPAFNFLFAVLAYWVLFVSGIPTVRPFIGEVSPDSHAAAAGLAHGDRILAVGGRETNDWETALVAMLEELVSDGRVTLTVESEDGWQRNAILDAGSERARLTEPGMLFAGLGFEPWQPPAIVGAVEEEGAAHAAGIREGDRIVEIDGQRIASFAQLQRVVSERPDQTVTVRVQRMGAEHTLDMRLGSREIDGRQVGFMGVSIGTAFGDHWYIRKFGPIASIGESLERTWNTTGFTVRMLGKMVTGEVSIKNISGPVNIAQYAGDSASAGMNTFLTFLALISISLGVLNLLPIPILDGGQIVYQTIELIKGSPLSDRLQLVGQQIGILALLVLMSFAFYNDIARIVNQ